MRLKGVYTALVTPFNKDGSVDWDAMKNLVEFQINEKISGLAPMGTTGESPTLSHEEHMQVVEFVVKQAEGRVPVIAGSGSNCTAEAIRMTKLAKDYGADVSLQVAPYYNKPSQEGLYKHFMTIADKVDIPLLVYNIPGRSGKNIENSTMLKLAKHQNIIAVKEASGNIAQVMELAAEKPADFDILSGDDNLGLPIIALGGTGIVSVASNIIPSQMVELVKEALAGNMIKARELHYRLFPLFKAEFIDTNPIPIKYMMSLKGMVKETYRLPLCEMSKDYKKQVKDMLEKMDLISKFTKFFK
ncbi:MAG: 4-hydroxy-tetrahydrodipicolinate synthase [Spirochaetia bacterium]|jgi:4-hydroxy-tetrahydrodipicolinate synthase|nr:4-hydroxy-tetrahydrodipicolinate synthase [Spirochaetia bacterium]